MTMPSAPRQGEGQRRCALLVTGRAGEETEHGACKLPEPSTLAPRRRCLVNGAANLAAPLPTTVAENFPHRPARGFASSLLLTVVAIWPHRATWGFTDRRRSRCRHGDGTMRR